MANRSLKTSVSARVSNMAAALLQVMREDSGESCPALLERLLMGAATDEQISKAASKAALLDREARLNRAARAMKRLCKPAEIQEVVERATR